MNKLIISGHSFGGMTAIAVGNSDKRVKACLTLDPWFFSYHKEMEEGTYKINIP